MLSPEPLADDDEMRLGISMSLSGEVALDVKLEVVLPVILVDVPSCGSGISMLLRQDLLN